MDLLDVLVIIKWFVLLLEKIIKQNCYLISKHYASRILDFYAIFTSNIH